MHVQASQKRCRDAAVVVVLADLLSLVDVVLAHSIRGYPRGESAGTRLDRVQPLRKLGLGVPETLKPAPGGDGFGDAPGQQGRHAQLGGQEE